MNRPHSGLGISSFIVSLAAAILIFITLVIAGNLANTTPGGLDENSRTAMTIGFAIIGLVLLSLVALGLGIAGLFQKDRQKVFPILGTVFSSFTILGTIGLILLGLSLT
ncbi:hypothetical protein J3L11_15140 [Shewanella sp. 4t3-1-2LB]|uniref:hypothetical protein n=1 Tax=Shewanella sp. 4t3-1-2LB TaxID=2817682 RepID=UPI001A9841E0|nr:hypothetical protein [Shewanella sp. 4t3-1-2LB]MBO1272981.1 hypothetical protein [Shewanella sp. 4t3-1-2LB]